MRAKRNKAYKRTMALYVQTFKFRQPFQVIVDSEFVKAASKQNLDLVPRLQDILGGQVKMMITQCCIQRLYSSSPSSDSSNQPAIDLAKSFERRRCNHWQVKETDDECIAGIVGVDNRYKYCVATQSPKLRKSLRSVPGVPLIFEKRAVVLLEPPSDASVGRKHQVEESKLHVPVAEAVSLGLVKAEGPGDEASEDGRQENNATASSSYDTKQSLPAATRATQASLPNTAEQMLAKRATTGKRKRAKEPNPLSIKRKKKETGKEARKPRTNASGPSGSRHVDTGGEGGKENKAPRRTANSGSTNAKEAQKAEGGGEKSQTTTTDPTKGVKRPEGPGTSKKALKRKRKKAMKEAAEGAAKEQSKPQEAAASSS